MTCNGRFSVVTDAVTDLGGMLSICMDASQVVLNSVDCTGVRNACEDLTASEYDASSMVPRWTALPRLLEPRPMPHFGRFRRGKRTDFL